MSNTSIKLRRSTIERLRAVSDEMLGGKVGWAGCFSANGPNCLAGIALWSDGVRSLDIDFYDYNSWATPASPTMTELAEAGFAPLGFDSKMKMRLIGAEDRDYLPFDEALELAGIEVLEEQEASHA